MFNGLHQWLRKGMGRAISCGLDRRLYVTKFFGVRYNCQPVVALRLAGHWLSGYICLGIKGPALKICVTQTVSKGPRELLSDLYRWLVKGIVKHRKGRFLPSMVLPPWFYILTYVYLLPLKPSPERHSLVPPCQNRHHPRLRPAYAPAQ